MKFGGRSAALAAVITAATLVPLAVFGGIGLAKGFPSASEYQYKITICHHTHSKTNPQVTISISNRAWPAHQRHHDTLGPCKDQPGSPTPGSPTHGNSGNHGNGHHGKP